MKPINNSTSRKWAQLGDIYKENYHNNETEDANFVIPVTFLNIIYLLKNDKKL